MSSRAPMESPLVAEGAMLGDGVEFVADVDGRADAIQDLRSGKAKIPALRIWPIRACASPKSRLRFRHIDLRLELT